MGAANQRAEAGPETAQAHRPVLLESVLEGLRPQAGGVYCDATYGRGGHAEALLQRIGPGGRLIVADRDPEAVAAARQRHGSDERVTVLHCTLAELHHALDELQLRGRLDGLLADLGVSSPQVDDPQRGFSFQRDGPLDMRMDPGAGESARELLARTGERDLARILRDHAEERQARRIARAIVRARDAGSLPETTGALAALVESVVPRREPGRHPATRTFQALRIAVNDELGQIDGFLEHAIDLLAPGGRLAVIAFHSLEDRRVKRFIRRASSVGDLPPSVPVVPEEAQPRLKPVGRAIQADDTERDANPRARSAVLRIAERVR